MSFAERLRLAVRYTFAFGQGYLSTFLSSLSMLGLVLAISLLITVLSVMNGFDKEMRERILSLVPHVTIYSNQAIDDWPTQLATLRAQPDVAQASAFAEFDTLIMRGSVIETAKGIGLDRDDKAALQKLLMALTQDQQQAFLGADEGIVLGRGVAQRLQVKPGDKLTLIVPEEGSITRSRKTRSKVVSLSGVLDTGTELDEAMALVHLPLASELAGLGGGVSGFRIATHDLFDVQSTAWKLLNALPPQFYATHWLMTHGNLYAAIQLSRNLVSILLFSIIAVAAFNVVSSLVLVVMDKQGNIAILRTLGAGGRDIAWIFVLQGAMIGVVGAVLGSLCGAALSQLVPKLVSGLEQLLDMRFLNTDVYPVSFLPVEILLSDILLVSGVAFVMCVLAAIYPALRAAHLAPAIILSQDR
ncbi:MAG: lipoprotein-releasing ABC transporter permease subunit [Halioglobus sp.]